MSLNDWDHLIFDIFIYLAILAAIIWVLFSR